jgi:hypothetical protein
MRRRRRFRALRRPLRVLLAAPPGIQTVIVVVALVALALAVNWSYQVVRKPTELFFPVSGALSKAPPETWAQYEPIFHEHSTAVITPEFLAALAQVEGAGNPVARTYWRWRFTSEPFDLYRPASTAVGMYQTTNATFREAKRYCVHDHKVVQDGAWYDFNSCWFNALYMRVVPSHAVEMTAALLDRRVAQILAGRAATTLQQKQNLAAVIHLCGAAAGESYARREFQLTPGQHCGDHDIARYLDRLNAMKSVFSRLANGR